ncbi:MAG: hypothetical protein J6M18_04745, partial [Actinomycetaceae bacterium]|nr:hypothetical protein [Actinomycetaceae bacterium]
PITLAIGNISWTQEATKTSTTTSHNEHINHDEPALLRSASIQATEDGDTHITLTQRCEINPFILHALRTHGMPAEHISQLRTISADPNRSDEAIARIRELGRIYLPDFHYQGFSLLGSFINPNTTILSDLEAMKPHLETSGIIAALAGDEKRKKLCAQPVPPLNKKDRIPETERGIGDLDVEELAVVEAIASGRSLIINTPIAARTHETLTSIFADAAASGRSVMYIPMRPNLGKALARHIKKEQLDDILLDFSSIDDVPLRLRTGMRLKEAELDDQKTIDMRESLIKARQTLRNYIDNLHNIDPAWNESVYSLLQRMAQLMEDSQAPQSRVRLSLDNTQTLKNERDRIQENLIEAASLGAFLDAEEASPWYGAPITNVEQGERARQQAERLATETIPIIMAQSHRVASESKLVRAQTLNEWLEQITMLDNINSTFDVFKPEIYENSVHDMIIATASKEWRNKHKENMSYSDRRRLTKQAQTYVKPGLDVVDMHDALTKVQNVRGTWRKFCKEAPLPIIPDGMEQIKISASELVREIKALKEDLNSHLQLEDMALEKILETTRRLTNDEKTLNELPRRNELIDSLTKDGMKDILDDFSERHVEGDMVEKELDLIYASSVFEQLVSSSSHLSDIGSSELSRLALSVMNLDKEHTQSLKGPVLRAVIRNMREAISLNRDETMQLDNQLEQFSTGMLKDSLATYPRLVQSSRPVWIIPPVMVSEFVPPIPWVDLVIIDGTENIPTSYLVSLLMRGRQIVIVGDMERALPHSAIHEFSQILPAMTLPTLHGNRDILAGAALKEAGHTAPLLIPQAIRPEEKLTLVDGKGVPLPKSGRIESTSTEVETVIDAIVEHILTKPERSLGVIALSPYHAQCITTALQSTIKTSSVLQEYVQEKSEEPFIITDITQATALKRDDIILSVGFAKTVHGRVLHSFGILAEPEGFLGFVDALEAPRINLHVISSIAPGDMKRDSLSSPGPRLLADVLERVGGESKRHIPTSIPTHVDAPLLSDLGTRIEQAGWRTAMNFGFKDDVRIPLVAGSDDFASPWRIAVLIDNDEYIQEPSQRRRDRYWIERLEERGWLVMQTFSTSLFIDPVGQAERIIEQLEAIKKQELQQATPTPYTSLNPDWKEVLREEAMHIRERKTRPNISAGLPLAAYSDDELDQMVIWIMSDGRRRNEIQLVRALREELGVNRQGAQIDAVLRNVVRRSGLASPDIRSSLSAQSAVSAAVALTSESPEEPVVDNDDSLLENEDEAEGITSPTHEHIDESAQYEEDTHTEETSSTQQNNSYYTAETAEYVESPDNSYDDDVSTNKDALLLDEDPLLDEQ